MISAFAILFVSVVTLLSIYLVDKYTYWKRRGIPTAKGIVPILGHLLPCLAGKLNLSELNRKIYQDHKNVSMVGYYKMTAPVLIIRDLELTRIILQTNFSSFQATGVKLYPHMDPLLANNPFFTVGETWAKSRKRLVWAFSNVKLKMLFTPVKAVCKKFVDFIDRRLNSSSKCELEMKMLFSKYTGEVVANAGMGIEGFCFEDKVHPEAFDQIANWLFTSSLKQVIEMTVVFVPSLNELFKMRMIPKKMDAFFRGIVSENMKLREKDRTPRNDLIHLLLEYEKEKGESINEELVASDALSLYLDGYETSSITLSFIGYQLAAHPNVQEKLREEVLSTIAKHGGNITFESLRDMKYMDQVIDESQRMFPAVGYLTRVCVEEFELRGSDGLVCQVKPGMEVIICNHGIQLDPEYWQNPEVFDPDRFSEERKHSIVKLSHLPFGTGPRICAGLKLAQLQMKASLATLMSKYKLEVSERTQRPLKLSGLNFLTEPIGGLWVYVSKL